MTPIHSNTSKTRELYQDIFYGGNKSSSQAAGSLTSRHQARISACGSSFINLGGGAGNNDEFDSGDRKIGSNGALSGVSFLRKGGESFSSGQVPALPAPLNFCQEKMSSHQENLYNG